MIDFSTDPRFQITPAQQKSIDEMNEANKKIREQIEMEWEIKRLEKLNKGKGKKVK